MEDVIGIVDLFSNSKMRLTPSESGILEAATGINLKPLSEVQSVKAMTVLDRARNEGSAVETV